MTARNFGAPLSAIIISAFLTLAVGVPVAQATSAPVVLAWSPTTSSFAYAYGALDAGTSQTKSVTFTLTNSGGSASAMLKITLSGSSAFTKTADTCSATSVGPKKSCSVTVEYAPTTNGESDSAVLTASGQKPPATAGITLSGKSGAPDLVISPGMSQGTAPDGSNEYSYPVGGGGTQKFIVTNEGTDTTINLTTTVEPPPPLGPWAIPNNCEGNSPAPGGMCEIDVTFTPPAGCASMTSYNLSLELSGANPYLTLNLFATCP